jgi:hypothetical protein
VHIEALMQATQIRIQTTRAALLAIHLDIADMHKDMGAWAVLSLRDRVEIMERMQAVVWVYGEGMQGAVVEK